MKALAPRSSNYIKTVLRQIFNFARSRDLYFKENPAMKIKIKLADNKRTRFLTKQEAVLLLDKLYERNINLYDMALLSLYTGLRSKEIRFLKWEHIMWDTNRLFAKWRKNGNTDLIPLHPRLREALERRYKIKDSEFIFHDANGIPFKEIAKAFSKCVKELGLNNGITDKLNKVIFHTLRHTYASWLVTSGVDLYTTQRLMGHKSIHMTQRYSHLAPEYLEKAVNNLPKI